MNDGHLRQRIRHDQRDACSKQIGKNDCRACEADGYAASQEEAYADGAANRHHCELPLAKTAVEAVDFRHRRQDSGAVGRGFTLEYFEKTARLRLLAGQHEFWISASALPNRRTSSIVL